MGRRPQPGLVAARPARALRRARPGQGPQPHLPSRRRSGRWTTSRAGSSGSTPTTRRETRSRSCGVACRTTTARCRCSPASPTSAARRTTSTASGLPHPGRWNEILNTDVEAYGGSGVGNLGSVVAEEVPWHGQPCSALVTLPPLAAVWLEPAEPVVPDRSRAAAQVVPGTVSAEQADEAASAHGTSGRTGTVSGRRRTASGATASRHRQRRLRQRRELRRLVRLRGGGRDRGRRRHVVLGGAGRRHRWRRSCLRPAPRRTRPRPRPPAPAAPQAARPRRSDHERSPRRHPAQAADLVDVAHLVTAYYTQLPDPGDIGQRVAFGTSGHRGSSLRRRVQRGPHRRDHARRSATTARRRATTGRCSSARDTHALSEPAWATALEVLAANDVTVLVDDRDGYTPTPGGLARDPRAQPGRRCDGPGLADGIVVTPVAQPARRRRLQVQPAERRPGRHRRHQRGSRTGPTS